MKLKILIALFLIVGIAVFSIAASTGSSSSGTLKDKTKAGVTTWTVHTTAIDTSEVIDMANLDNLVVQWKVTNTDTVLMALYFWESCNGTDWGKSDSSVTITSTNKTGIQKVNLKGCRQAMITAKGFVGNTNSKLVLDYTTN